MNHRFAFGDPLLEHVTNAAVVGRKIGLLDRHAPHREQGLFHQLANTAQVAGGGGDENSGSRKPRRARLMMSRHHPSMIFNGSQRQFPTILWVAE